MEALYLTVNETDEQVFLPTTLNLQDYACGILDATGSFEPYTGKPLFLCCDFIRPSVVGDKLLPALRRIPVQRKKKGNIDTGKILARFHKLLWFPVTRAEVGEIRVYITGKDGEVPSFDNFTLNCTLVCIPPKNNHTPPT